MQLIIRVNLWHIWKIPCAKLIHQRLRSRGRVELSLLVEVSLRRILQYAVSHLQISQFLCTLLLFNPCLQICKDIIHVVEAVICSLVILSVIVGLRLSVIISAASHLLNYSFFKSWELFDCRWGNLRVKHRGLGINSYWRSIYCLQIFFTIWATARLNRIIMEIFAEGTWWVLLELSCLQTNSRLREEILERRRFLINWSHSEVSCLFPLARIDLVNPKFLLALSWFQTEWGVALERHYI